MFMKFFLLLFVSVSFCTATSAEHRDCIILVDDSENIGRLEKFALVAILQSAIAEQAAPILLNASILNLFNERRIMVEQNLHVPNSRERKVYNFFQKMNERFAYLSNYYNQLSSDVLRNKELVVRKINKEFYLAEDRINLSPVECQLLLDYSVSFNLQDWRFFKNEDGYYLLVPKKYVDRFTYTGFRLDSLEEVSDPFDTGYLFFETQKNVSLAKVLQDFFVTNDDSDSLRESYVWNIVMYGHGGLYCRESNNNDTISWSAGPLIVNMSLEDFKETLAFFNACVHTHCIYYISCYAGGNHSKIIFNSSDMCTYNFALVCGTLTDCAHLLRYNLPVPSSSKRILSTAEVIYNEVKNEWVLPLKCPIRWKDYFKEISDIDFSIGSLERMPRVLSGLKTNHLSNIPLLCLPGTVKFFSISGVNAIKIDDLLLDAADEVAQEKLISIYGHQNLFIESVDVQPTVMLEYQLKYRFISVKPGDAVHYFKRIKSVYYLDLPSLFWQVESQSFNKTFVIDECIFPYQKDARMFKDISPVNNSLALKNVLIMQYKSDYIRLFFTVDDAAIMVVAHKPDAFQDKATIQEVVKLSPQAKARYEAYYDSLCQSLQPAQETTKSSDNVNT